MATRGVEMTITYVAWDTSVNAGKTNDVGNHTLRWVKDGTASATTNSASEVDSVNCPGLYKLTVTSTETACNIGVLAGKSSTSNVSIVPIIIQFERLPDAAPGSNGGVPTCDASNIVQSNVAQISGDSTAADNLEADYDGTGSNSQRPVSAKFVADIVETQRGSHTWSGNIYYVDGYGGNDTTGNGSRALPYKTISKALTQCTSGNHDVIECLGNPNQIPTVITETATVTVSKAYTFIRGPGRGVQVDLSGAGYVFDIQAVGVEICGFDIVGNGTGSSGGITVTSADFARLRRLWIASPTQDGIQLNVSNNTLIDECVLTGAGRDNIRVASGAGAGQYTRITNSTIRDAVGSGVNLVGSDASESHIRFNIIRDNAVGITVGAGVLDTVITDNRFINNTSTISDSGTRTLQAWNFFTTDTSGQVTVGTNSDKAGYSLSATGLAAITSWTVNITGNLSGSVGSVTGAVGSVTGAVGSVTAAVTVGTINDGAVTADVVADIFSTTALTEAYAADGAAGTAAQLFYQIQQALTEFVVSGTTITVKKLDGSTTASTYTLDSATTPTSRTRAT